MTDPVAETFRQLERFQRTSELPDLEVVTDAWIIMETRRRELDARVKALKLVLMEGHETARDDLARAERSLKTVREELDIITMLREDLVAKARGSRDYESARAALGKLRRDRVLQDQDRERLRDAAEGWKGM